MADCPGHFGHIELADPVFHAGFMVKVKKILECVCVSCGKLRLDMVSVRVVSEDSCLSFPQRDPAVAFIVRRHRPQARLKAIWALASKKMVCETDELNEDEDGDATYEDEFQRERRAAAAAAQGHGGCGTEQPVWRKEALKLYGITKAAKGEKGEVTWSSLL